MRASPASTFPAVLLALSVGVAGRLHAQTITTVADPVMPVVAAPVPTNGVWMLAALMAVLLFAGWAVFRKGCGARVLRSLAVLAVAVSVAGLAGFNPVARAQQLLTMLSFTQSGGETLSIPVAATPATGAPTAFTPVQFTNASQGRLKISQITPPSSSAACFPSGVPAVVPNTPLPAGATPCSDGLQLASNASCVVDVASMCAQTVASISLDQATATFEAHGSTSLTVTASAATTQPALNVAASIPSGSQLVVQGSTCGASLAPGASCKITLSGAAAEGPTAVAIAGSNTSAVTSSVTVTPATVSPTISASITSASFEAGSTSSITVTANAAASQPAQNVSAIVASGSQLVVKSSTCGAVLAPGASCTITLLGPVPEGPTAVAIAGSNTNTVQVSVTVVPAGPVLTAVSRATCNSAGARYLTLTGTGLSQLSAVMLGNIPAPAVSVSSDTQAVVTLPANWVGGRLNVTATTPFGTSAALDRTFDAPVLPQFCAGGTTPDSYGMFSIFGTAQTNGVTGLCLLCGVVNPNNPINNANTDDYSSFAITVGLLGVSVEQTLIDPVASQAPSSGTRRVGVIVSDDTANGITAAKLGGVSLTAMNGSTSSVTAAGSALTLLSLVDPNPGDTRKMLVMDVPAGQPFDRVQLSLNSVLVGAIQGLRVYAGVVEQSVR